MVESLKDFELSVEELHSWRQESRSHALVDVRNVEELGSFSFKEAHNIPLDRLYEMKEKLPSKDEPIVLICAHGRRSLKACFFLRHQGFKKVYSLSGGVAQWQELKQGRNN
jgi:rhodanese-related sulfurtransferase